jgi:hypothetical protein
MPAGVRATVLGDNCQRPYVKTIIVRPGGALRYTGDRSHSKVTFVLRRTDARRIVFNVVYGPARGTQMCSAEFYFADGSAQFTTRPRGGSRIVTYDRSKPTGGLTRFVFRTARHRSLAQGLWAGPNIRPTPSASSFGSS